MSTTTPLDITENELERRWAQILCDTSQPSPPWIDELNESVLADHGTLDMLSLALDIIELFPPNANNDQVTAVIEERLAEEMLHTESWLIDWLYGDKMRSDALDEALQMEPPVHSLEEALRRAWSVELRNVIATVRVELDKHESPTFCISDVMP